MHRVYRWVGVAGLLVATGCYRSVPIETSTPPVGETISFVISDRGRVSLGERLGPGVARIDGRIVETAGEQYVVSVFRVANISGQTSIWSGETIRLDREFVEQLRARELNKGRSWLLAAGVTSAVVLFIVTRNLLGFGQDDEEPGENPEPPTSRRARPAFR